MSRLITVSCILVILSGCTGMGARDAAVLLIGNWQTDLAGFSVSTVYSDESVMVEGQAAQPYVLDGDTLVINNDLTTARQISFNGRNEMKQKDLITGTVHVYTRSP